MIAIGEGGRSVGGWVTKIVTKKIEPTFLIFLAVIFVTHFSPSQSRWTLEFAILRLCPTFLRIKNFQKCLTNMQYCKFEGPVIVMGGGADDENCGCKKLKTTKLVGFSLTFTAI